MSGAKKDGIATFHKRKSGGHYARLMGTLWRHLKPADAGDAALGMWTRMLSYCADNGRVMVSKREMKILMAGDKNGPRKLAALIKARLIDEVEGGYTPHDWYDHNPGIKPVDDQEEERGAPSETPHSDDRTGEEREPQARDGEGIDIPIVTGIVTRNVSNDTEQKQHVTDTLSRPYRPKTQESLRETHRERVCVQGAGTVSFAAKVQVRFRALHLDRFEVEPSMGGRSVADFPARLAASAEKRGLDPLALLESTFAAWCAAGRPGTDKSGEYAAFVTRFSSLVAPHRNVRGGHVAPAPASAFKHMPKTDEEAEAQLDRIFGPEPKTAGAKP